MLGLAVGIFTLVVFTEITSWIGKDRIIDFFYSIVLRITNSPLHKRRESLKKELLDMSIELRKTSSQDEFAKWAKLKRKLDKGATDLEKLNGEIAAKRSRFGMQFQGVLFVVTTVVPFAVTSWHGKQAVFYLPKGWFGPSGWFLGLPMAPAGAVSCGVWSMVCKRVLKVLEGAFAEIFEGIFGPATSQIPPVPVTGEKDGGPPKTPAKIKPTDSGAKKEL